MLVYCSVAAGGGLTQAGSLTEAKINFLGHTDLGPRIELSNFPWDSLSIKKIKFWLKLEMAAARIQDGGTSALSCPGTTRYCF